MTNNDCNDCDLLNEMQDKIQKQADVIDMLRAKVESFEILMDENNKLRKEINYRTTEDFLKSKSVKKLMEEVLDDK